MRLGDFREEKNCGVRVRRLDLSQAVQIYQVRISPESLIGELVTQNLTPDASTHISRVLDSMADAVQREDMSAYTILNFEFHDLLARFTTNEALYGTYSCSSN